MQLEEMMRTLEISGQILQQQVDQMVNSVNAHILRTEEEVQDVKADDEITEFASSVTLFGAQNTAVLAAIPAKSVTRTSCKIVESAAVQTALVEASAIQETVIHTAAAENIAALAVKNSDFAADQAAEDRDGNCCPLAETAKITLEIIEFAAVQVAENRDSNSCQTAITTAARKSAPAEVPVTSPAAVHKPATAGSALTEPEPAEISETDQPPAEPAQPTAVFAQTTADMAEYNMQAAVTEPAQKPKIFTKKIPEPAPKQTTKAAHCSPEQPAEKQQADCCLPKQHERGESSTTRLLA
ncbi:translation initiation factor IF-2-like [Manihot esculenta]|uniref:translation initiation factor IF-2-like n=1 Tax=Manihot esculenta TaxID=3983 RepID=UPI001CC74C2E|nr:translation initiation factor IF-2-like [Manihot esculenta]